MTIEEALRRARAREYQEALTYGVSLGATRERERIVDRLRKDAQGYFKGAQSGTPDTKTKYSMAYQVLQAVANTIQNDR